MNGFVMLVCWIQRFRRTFASSELLGLLVTLKNDSRTCGIGAAWGRQTPIE
jgi:hypothetical protein